MTGEKAKPESEEKCCSDKTDKGSCCSSGSGSGCRCYRLAVSALLVLAGFLAGFFLSRGCPWMMKCDSSRARAMHCPVDMKMPMDGTTPPVK
ncbi:MAG: hypothetical protein IPP35_01840 [Elusimicrobia bacterium]|nr:hypothetical protein [Elusimicrobiota bacterium]